MRPLFIILWLVFTSQFLLANNNEWPEIYNVVWNSQSKNSSESMPCGGGQLGLNIWVENGDILFYIGQAGSMDENGTLLKPGRVRIQMYPNLFIASDLVFSQKLELENGSVLIEGTSKSLGLNAKLRFWVEVKRPVVHIDMDSNIPVNLISAFESWRYQDLYLPQVIKSFNEEVFSQRALCMETRVGDPDSVFVYKDNQVAKDKLFYDYHKVNNAKDIFENAMITQDLKSIREKLDNPLLNLVWGTAMGGKEWKFSRITSGSYSGTPYKGWEYETTKRYSKLSIKIACPVEQNSTPEKWQEQVNLILSYSKESDALLWKKNQDWWQQFWSGSYVIIDKDKETDASRYSQAYTLFRYMQAANLNGNYPTLFNGGVYTFDPEFTKVKGPLDGFSGEKGYTPDYRWWGAGFTGQNQRLVYWPMLKNGDFELMKPQFDYFREGLNNTVQRTKYYWGIDGCSFSEQPSVLHLPGNATYGFVNGLTHWNRRNADLENGVDYELGIRRIWESQLEFSWMILQYYSYTGNDIREYLPFIEKSVIFYDEYYRKLQRKRSGTDFDKNNKLAIQPANTLEKHSNAKNPASIIAGLTVILNDLIRLPDQWQEPGKKNRWQEMLQHLPPLPIGEYEGHPYMQPAENIPNNWHTHSPEMYPLYPYQIFGIGLPGLEIMDETFTMYGLFGKSDPREIRRENYPAEGWSQLGVHAARLGDVKTSKALLENKLDGTPFRFPAFYAGGDWGPDHNWAGTGQIHLQEMLLQTHGGKLHILPCWPSEWDVEFKLHAPQQTTVECSYKNGKIEKLKVSPSSREKDIVLPAFVK